jgi:uncharacterized protein (TIGR00255 family)
MNSSQSATPQPARAHSMTGFARVRRMVGETEVTVSVKSVNHRALDIHFHCSSELDPLEGEMRAMLRRRLTRGHVEVRISMFGGAAAARPALNRPLLEAYIGGFQEAVNQYSLPDATPDLNAALRVPGMFGDTAEREIGTTLHQAILEALAEALDHLNIARQREAAELVAAMLRHNEHIRSAATELAAIRSRAIPLFEARLSERLRDLLRGQTIDPQRLAQEVAILADRSDITEEIARLEIHSGQLAELLKGGGELGKKLDFLLQEMNRETNTILSKTNGLGEIGLRITELALGAKAEIEKIREQSLNLE